MPLYQLYPISVTDNPTADGNIDFSTIDDLKGQPDDASTRAKIRQNQCASGTGGTRWRYGLTALTFESVASVSLFIRQRAANPVELTPPAVQAGLYDTVGTAEEIIHSVRPPRDATWRDYIYPMAVDPFTSAAWDPADLAGYELFLRGSDPATSDAYITQMYLDVEGVIVAGAVAAEEDGDPLGLGRGAMSAIVQIFGRPLPIVQLDLPLRYFDVPVMRWLTVSHYAGPDPDSAGWDSSSDKPWRRRRVFVLSKQITPGQPSIRIRGLLDRHIVRRLWDVLVSEESPKPELASGMARFHPAGRRLIRDTAAWVENAEAEAQGSMNIVALARNEDKHAAGGTWFERTRTNWLLYNTGVSGLTGLTLTGTGVNGSAIAVETYLVFDADITDNSLRFTAGIPVADVYATWPATTEYHKNSVVSLQFIHFSDSPPAIPMGSLSWSLQRGVDSYYYTAGAGTWGAAVAWNALSITELDLREVIPNINIGSSPTTLTLRVGIVSMGINGQQNILHHVSLIDGYNVGTPIVSDTTITHCAEDELRFASLHGRQLAWNPEHGTVFAEFTPDFDSDDLPTGAERTVIEILYPNQIPWIQTVEGTEENEFSVRWVDDDDFHRLSYVKGTGWRFRHRRNGVDSNSVLAGTAIAGQTYKLGGTWTGTQEEQDRAAYTQSVHVDGVRGSDTVAVGVHAPLPSRALVTVGSSQRWRPTDISGCTLWIEGDRGLWKNGSLEELGMGHGLYEDEEVTRWEDFSDAGLDLIGQGKPRLIFTDLAGTYDTVHFAVNEPDAYFDGPILPTMSETHWFFLVWFNNVTDGRYLLGSSTGGLQGALRTSGSKLQVLGAGSTWLDLINPIEPSVWLILEVIQYSGSMQGMKNGIHGGARVTLTPNYSGQNLQIGADAGLTTKDMTLYSIIVYDHVLPMDQARIPTQYLASKGSLSLLGSHHRPVFNHADGRIKHIRVTDVVLHDDEIADLP